LADEEAAATFPAELKKSIKKGKYDTRIRLKRQNPLLSYVRERERQKGHCKCTM